MGGNMHLKTAPVRLGAVVDRASLPLVKPVDPAPVILNGITRTNPPNLPEGSRLIHKVVVGIGNVKPPVLNHRVRSRRKDSIDQNAFAN